MCFKKYKRIFINDKPTEYFVSKNGDVISKYKNKDNYHLKVFETDRGYQYVKLWINNKSKAKFIHRLVAEAYIDNPCNKPEVNHIDGIKSHNYVDNLEWVTSKENKRHAKDHGLINIATCEKRSKINSNENIHLVCKLLEENKKSVNEISKITGVSTDLIYGIRTKGLWHDISKNYNIPEVQYKKSRAYSEDDIIPVCEYLEEGNLSVSKISELTGVKKGTIRDILNRRRWVEISSNYNFSKFKK